MTLAAFVATENSQALDYDGIPADTGQCVQPVSYYCVNVLDITPPLLNAVDWWYKFATTPVLIGNFDQIPYNANSLPLAGDIVVFGPSASINSPIYGHIDICIQNGTAAGYIGFDSNWGGDYNSQGYPVAHQVAHTYNDVLGFLRFNGGSEMQDQLNQIQASLNSLYQIVNTLNVNMGNLINPGARLDTDYANIETTIARIVQENNLKN